MLKPQVIIDYVNHIDINNDVVFGIHDDKLHLIGAAHVAFSKDEAEPGRIGAGGQFAGWATARRSSIDAVETSA